MNFLKLGKRTTKSHSLKHYRIRVHITRAFKCGKGSRHFAFSFSLFTVEFTSRLGFNTESTRIELRPHNRSWSTQWRRMKNQTGLFSSRVLKKKMDRWSNSSDQPELLFFTGPFSSFLFFLYVFMRIGSRGWGLIRWGGRVTVGCFVCGK